LVSFSSSELLSLELLSVRFFEELVVVVVRLGLAGGFGPAVEVFPLLFAPG